MHDSRWPVAHSRRTSSRVPQIAIVQMGTAAERVRVRRRTRPFSQINRTQTHAVTCLPVIGLPSCCGTPIEVCVNRSRPEWATVCQWGEHVIMMGLETKSHHMKYEGDARWRAQPSLAYPRIAPAFRANTAEGNSGDFIIQHNACAVDWDRLAYLQPRPNRRYCAFGVA